MASPVPVLPEVGSTIVPPGRSFPSRSAASIRAVATRSLIEPPGLKTSSFAASCGRSPAAILEALAADARISNQRIAERVGIAPSTSLARLRALRERGVIRGYHAEVNLAALGRPLQALIAVRLAVHAREQIDAFTSAVSE